MTWLGTRLLMRFEDARDVWGFATNELRRSEQTVMTCLKCGGFLVSEPSVDFYVQSEKLRCINCGALREGSAVAVLKPSFGCGSSSRETLTGQRRVRGNHRVKTAIRR